MTFEDRITIATPEGVDLDLALAGLGSRFIAALLDDLIRFIPSLLMVAFIVSVTRSADPDVAAMVAAIGILFLFLLYFGYDVLFETFRSGRTPGKRAVGIRVVRLHGEPVNFTSAVVRNLLRLVDGLPFGYLVGMICILASSKNQRLGDMAAGTLVMRERRGDARPTWARNVSYAQPDPKAASWDVSGITNDEVIAVRRFLERRYELPNEARDRLAWELAERLRSKVAGAPSDQHPEYFLEQLAAAKATR